MAVSPIGTVNPSSGVCLVCGRGFSASRLTSLVSTFSDFGKSRGLLRKPTTEIVSQSKGEGLVAFSYEETPGSRKQDATTSGRGTTRRTKMTTTLLRSYVALSVSFVSHGRVSFTSCQRLTLSCSTTCPATSCVEVRVVISHAAFFFFVGQALASIMHCCRMGN